MRIKALLLTLACLLSQVQADSLKKLNLVDYVEIVSHTIKVPIYVADDVPALEVSFFLPSDVSNKLMLDTLKATLANRGLRLKKVDNVYFVEQVKPIEFHTYKFKNIETPDVSGIFSVVDNSTFSYLPSSHSVVYKANDIQHSKIQEFLKQIDIPLNAETIKVSIIRTDLSKLVQIGSKIGQFQLELNDFANYIFGIAGDTTSLTGGGIFGFKTLLSFLHQNEVINIEQSPTLHLFDGKLSSVSYVDNIPYLVTTNQVQDGKATTQETTEYKDVGLKLNVLPRINQDVMMVDFDLTVENLLSTSSEQKPRTRKIFLKQHFKIKKNEVILLSGLSKTESNEILSKVPILGDIPILNILFRYKDELKSTNVITVMVEILNTPSTAAEPNE
jgi:general secretion pathway protein D